MTKLTKAEADWLKKLQKILNDCPSDRLGFYTIGDPNVEVYDKTYEKEIDDLMSSKNKDFCQAVSYFEADLGRLDFPSHVHSTAG